MENICKKNDIAETAARQLLESWPQSLKARLRKTIAEGATAESIIERVIRLEGGQRTLTVLALEQFFASE